MHSSIEGEVSTRDVARDFFQEALLSPPEELDSLLRVVKGNSTINTIVYARWMIPAEMRPQLGVYVGLRYTEEVRLGCTETIAAYGGWAISERGFSWIVSNISKLAGRRITFLCKDTPPVIAE